MTDLTILFNQGAADEIILVEFNALKLADGSVEPLYFSKPAAYFPDKQFLPCIAELSELDRAAADTMDPAYLPTWGSVKLLISGAYKPDAQNSIPWNLLLYKDTYALSGQALTIKAGAPGDAYADFTTLFSGQIGEVSWTDAELTLEIYDKAKELETKYPDYELPESDQVDEDSYGAIVGFPVGEVKNVSPVLIKTGVPGYSHLYALACLVIDSLVAVYFNQSDENPPATPSQYLFTKTDVSPVTADTLNTGTVKLYNYGPYTGALLRAKWILEIASITTMNSQGATGPEVGLAWFRWKLEGGEWSALMLTWKLAYDVATLAKSPAVGGGVLTISGTYAGDCKLPYKLKISRTGDIGDAFPPQFIYSDDDGDIWQPANTAVFDPTYMPYGSYDPGTGKWINSPVPGPQMVADPGMDNAGDWFTGTGWTVSGGVATKTAGTASYLNDIVGSRPVAGRFYRLAADCVVTAGVIALQIGGGNFGANVAATGSYLATGRALNIGRASGYGVALFAGSVDNFNANELPFSGTMIRQDFGVQVGFSVELTLPVNMQGGVVVRYTDDDNFLLGYRGRTIVYLVQYVAGVATQLIGTPVAYVAGGVIVVRFPTDDTAQLWYAGSQVDADQDVSTVPPGTEAGLWLPDPSVEAVNPTALGIDIPAIESTPVALNRGLSAEFSGTGDWRDNSVWRPVADAVGVMTIASIDPAYDANLLELEITTAGQLGGAARFKWQYDSGGWTSNVEIPDTDPIQLFEGLEVQFTTEMTENDYDVGDAWRNIPYYVPAFVKDDEWAFNFKEVPVPLADGVSVQFITQAGQDCVVGDQFSFILMSTLKVNISDTTDVTVDMKGLINPATNIFAPTMGQQIYSLIRLFAGWDDTAFDLPSIAAFDLAIPYSAGVFIDSPEDLISIIGKLLTGIPALYSITIAGKFFIRELTIPSGVPVLTITDEQIMDLPNFNSLSGVIKRVYLEYAKNYTTHSGGDLSGVSQSRLAWLKKGVWQVSRKDDLVLVNYPLASDLGPLETALNLRADALLLADKWLVLFKVPPETMEVGIGLQAAQLNIGDIVMVIRNKFGQDTGQLYLAQGLNLDFTGRGATVTLWR